MGRRAIAVLSLLLLAVLASVPAAAADEVVDAPTETAVADDAPADGPAPVTEPVEQPAPPPTEGPVEEPAAPEEPPPPAAEVTDPAPTDAPTSPPDGSEVDEPTTAPDGEDADPGASPAEDAAEPAADTAEDDTEESVAEAQAVDPANVVVVEFGADGFCDLFGDDGASGASVDVAPAVAQAASVSYGDLVAQVDAVLARYPNAVLLSATYDGSSLLVVLVPDISECEGFEDVEPPQPVDDLDDVEVIAEVLPDEEVCALLEEGFGDEIFAAPSIDDLLSDEELAAIIDARFGPDLSEDELADLLGLAGELDPVLAEAPGGWADVTYDGEVLFIFVTPDPSTVDCGEGPVVAQPISNPAPPVAGSGGGTPGAGAGGDLAATGFDTADQLVVGLLALAAGLALVRAGRQRYRGQHRAA